MKQPLVAATPLIALATALVIAGASTSASACGGSDATGFDPCSYFTVSSDFRTLYWSRCSVEVPPGVLSVQFSCSTSDGESHQGSITVTRNNGVITSYSADIDGKHCSGTIP